LLICLFTSFNILLFKVKWHNKFHGVDPKVQTMTDEWFDLSALYGLKFDHGVTIGFGNINKANVVAQCEYGLGFREITIDSGYWDNMDSVERTMVLVHEMGHCYCNEGHQFGKEHTEYDSNGVDPPKGFFDDSCPKSFMYPYVIYQGCIYAHFSEYVDDMFDNCNPY
jgi:hypothetical protein